MLESSAVSTIALVQHIYVMGLLTAIPDVTTTATPTVSTATILSTPSLEQEPTPHSATPTPDHATPTSDPAISGVSDSSELVVGARGGCRIIGVSLGVTLAILLLILVGVVMGWVWSCHRKKLNR